MLAHAVHWSVQTRSGFGAVSAAALASLVAGSVLSPVARRFHLPFAGIGFASVVSMLPGIFIFPMGSALALIAVHGSASNPSLVAGAIGDGATALLVVLGMTCGLLCPKRLFDARRLQIARVERSNAQET